MYWVNSIVKSSIDELNTSRWDKLHGIVGIFYPACVTGYAILAVYKLTIKTTWYRCGPLIHTFPINWGPDSPIIIRNPPPPPKNKTKNKTKTHIQIIELNSMGNWALYFNCDVWRELVGIWHFICWSWTLTGVSKCHNHYNDRSQRYILLPYLLKLPMATSQL